MRFSGEGTEADANVYVKYTKKTTTIGEGWYDTKISVADVTEFNITNSSVEGFMVSTDYETDLTKTVVTNYSKSAYYRKDLPLPIRLKWENDLSVVETTVAINDKSGILNTGMKTYYVEGNELAIYNLIPNKTYYYIVSGLCADGKIKTLKSGNFTTKGITRMLNIEGTQNVRDIGGYSIGTQKVKYGSVATKIAYDGEAYIEYEWFEGNHVFDFTTPITEDITLTAKWNQKKYTISVTAIDEYSVDKMLTVYDEKGNKVNALIIKTLDGYILCENGNLAIEKNELNGISEVYVILSDGKTQVKATIKK